MRQQKEGLLRKAKPLVESMFPKVAKRKGNRYSKIVNPGIYSMNYSVVGNGISLVICLSTGSIVTGWSKANCVDEWNEFTGIMIAARRAVEAYYTEENDLYVVGTSNVLGGRATHVSLGIR